MIRELFLIVSVLLAAGCAAPKNNYLPKTIDISEPPLGVVIEKQVGDEMVRQGKYREHEAIYVQAQLKPVWAYTVMPGYFLKMGGDEAGDFYRIGGAGEESGYIEKNPFADPFIALMVKTDNTLCVITFINAVACGDVKSGFEKVKKPISSMDSMQRTLIYNGRVGDRINVGYREFSANMARPAFSNNVEYDLAESKEIGYRGARIEVLEATNRSIRYKLISNFNNAQR